MFGKIKIIITNLIVKKFYTFEGVFNKIGLKFFFKEFSISKINHNLWLNNNKTSIDSFMKDQSESLYIESKQFARNLKLRSKEIFNDIDFDLGGGGVYPLIYFLIKFLKPKTVLETGVASGFSSYTILTALEENKLGNLYSSDLPYFRISDPEKYIGILVPESLKKNWELYLGHDFSNLSKILKKVDSIDFFHYDSDKLYKARTKSFDLIKKRLNKNSIVMFDDIQDNTHFYDFIVNNKITNYRIFEFEGKFCGLIIDFKV